MSAEHAATAAALADEITARLTEPNDMTKGLESGSTSPGMLVSLGRGHSGIALLHLARGLVDPNAITTAHCFLQRAREGLTRQELRQSGIYGPLEGLGFALELTYRATGDYASALTTLDAMISRRVCAMAATLRADPIGSVMRFDVISGISGIGRYLLLRQRRTDLEAVLDALVVMTALRPYRNNSRVPGFWSSTPPISQFAPPNQDWSAGHLNLGLAHGVAGPLALMALAAIEGCEVEGQRAAIEELAELLLSQLAKDEYGQYWPPYISLAQWQGRASTGRRGRSAWCYGTPGIARALQLAATALESTHLRTSAENAIAGMLDTPPAHWQSEHWSICHGEAGILHLLSFFEKSRIGTQVSKVRNHVAQRIISRFADNIPTFRVTHPDAPHTDVAGYLEGAAGLALALDSYAGRTQAVAWDTALLVN
ncbi:lanthionine synthetase C family protein [Streptomyces olindensis]|uniref:lanthionine synthetase C family protein n=1 Tax=Streptomyces olindensis TaxID=358823 RepID=UPI0036BF3051